MKRHTIFILVYMICTCISVQALCYTYDYWGNLEKSPDTYRVCTVLNSSVAGIGKSMNKPSGIFCKGNDVYICDTGNNRILEFVYGNDKTLSLYRVIDRFFTDEKIPSTFSAPSDIYVENNGDLYICDPGNNRLVKLDKNLKFLRQFVQPNDATYDKNLSFIPEKAIADPTGRVYILAKNVNKGLLKYENTGKFTGFYGATEVTYNFADYIWKFFSTRKQKAQLESFVPTEYSNICLDTEGFIYAVTRTFEIANLKTDRAKPIRRLNALGQDILIKNGNWPPIGDLQWGEASDDSGPSRFTDITVLSNDIYVALDDTSGRLFGYDREGHLLYAFGGVGNMIGSFKKPVAIEHIGRDLFVLDSTTATLTVFSPTEYGKLVYAALDAYAKGDYDLSAEDWQKVMQLNGNYDLAYIGLGKAYLRQNKYKEAMKCFKLEWDIKDYSKVFALYRKDWVEAHARIIFVFILLAIFIPVLISEIKKIKWRIAYYEHTIGNNT